MTASAVVEAAQQAHQEDIFVFDEVTRQTADRISQATNCVTNVTNAINQQIPSFGGGLMGAVSNLLAQNLANEACSVARQAQNQVSSGISNFTSNPYFGAATSVLSNTTLPSTGGSATPDYAPSQSGSSSGSGLVQSVGNLLSRLF